MSGGRTGEGFVAADDFLVEGGEGLGAAVAAGADDQFVGEIRAFPQGLERGAQPGFVFEGQVVDGGEAGEGIGHLAAGPGINLASCMSLAARERKDRKNRIVDSGVSRGYRLSEPLKH